MREKVYHCNTLWKLIPEIFFASNTLDRNFLQLNFLSKFDCSFQHLNFPQEKVSLCRHFTICLKLFTRYLRTLFFGQFQTQCNMTHPTPTKKFLTSSKTTQNKISIYLFPGIIIFDYSKNTANNCNTLTARNIRFVWEKTGLRIFDINPRRN